MARTLIITNADFSVNKLLTVHLQDNRPCTGISLSASTAAITTVGDTYLLTATVTPANTSDAVIWSTSNSSVATVVNGTVTSTGCGTATITATCGEYSASCSITVTHVVTLSYTLVRNLNRKEGSDYCQIVGGNIQRYAVGYSESGTQRIGYSGTSGYIISNAYPVKIPNGATTMVVTAPNVKTRAFWMSTTTSSSAWAGYAKLYANDGSSETPPANIGDRTFTIPDRTSETYTGMDGVAFAFSTSDSSVPEMTDAFMQAVVVTFTA